MKREICALLLLAALVATSVWNIRRTDGLIEDVKEHLALSEKAVRAGDPDYAAEQLDAAFRVWRAAREFTQVFLRHPELDDTCDVFYEAMRQLDTGEIRAIPAAYEQLRYHLDSIARMEHIGWGSVF